MAALFFFKSEEIETSKRPTVQLDEPKLDTLIPPDVKASLSSLPTSGLLVLPVYPSISHYPSGTVGMVARHLNSRHFSNFPVWTPPPIPNINMRTADIERVSDHLDLEHATNFASRELHWSFLPITGVVSLTAVTILKYFWRHQLQLVFLIFTLLAFPFFWDASAFLCGSLYLHNDFSSTIDWVVGRDNGFPSFEDIPVTMVFLAKVSTVSVIEIFDRLQSFPPTTVVNVAILAAFRLLLLHSLKLIILARWDILSVEQVFWCYVVCSIRVFWFGDQNRDASI